MSHVLFLEGLRRLVLRVCATSVLTGVLSAGSAAASDDNPVGILSDPQNTFVLDIVGFGNGALGAGDLDLVGFPLAGMIEQTGRDNRAEFAVDGTENGFAIVQMGRENRTIARVFGVRNIAIMRQAGLRNMIGVSQFGSGNMVVISQGSW